MINRKKKILWVDDDLGILIDQIAEISDYYDVVSVRNPDEAWAAINEEKSYGRVFDGMIVDILLPYGKSIPEAEANGGLRTGIAFVMQIKATSEFNKIPIIVYTIRDSTDVDEAMSQFGIPVIRKQSGTEELIIKAQEYFK